MKIGKPQTIHILKLKPSVNNVTDKISFVIIIIRYFILYIQLCYKRDSECLFVTWNYWTDFYDIW